MDAHQSFNNEVKFIFFQLNVQLRVLKENNFEHILKVARVVYNIQSFH